MSDNNIAKKSFLKIFSVLLGLGIVILLSLQFVPRTPTVEQEELDLKKALSIIEKGEDPMAGILLLREILEKDPDNVDAIWEMGKLSMQSGQYDKAVERFKRFVSLTEGQENVSGLIYLSDAYFFNEQRELAKETLTKAFELNENEELAPDIEERISIINKN